MIQGQIEQIGPKEANDYLLKNAFNRPLQRQHIIALARQMSQKLWKLTGEPIIFDENGQLQDGQHRLRAIVHSGTTQSFYVVRGTLEEAFLVMDTGKKRSPSDALYIAGISQPGLYGSLAGKIIRWERMIFFGGKNAALNPTNEEIVNFCLKHKKDLATSINYYLQVKSRCRGLISGGSFLFAYHMCRMLNDAQAFDFFERFLSGNTKDHRKYQPVTILRERLIRNKADQAKLPHRTIILMVFIAWNAYRKNGQLDNLNSGISLSEAKRKKIELF